MTRALLSRLPGGIPARAALSMLAFVAAVMISLLSPPPAGAAAGHERSGGVRGADGAGRRMMHRMHMMHVAASIEGAPVAPALVSPTPAPSEVRSGTGRPVELGADSPTAPGCPLTFASSEVPRTICDL